MSIGQSNFQWETLLDDAEWDRAESLEQLVPTAPSHEPTRPSLRSPVRRTIGLLALSGVLACTLILWLAAQRGVSAIDGELHDVIEVENWLQRSDHFTATASLVDADADPAWQAAHLRELELASESAQGGRLQQTLVERTRLRSGLAMVQVTVTDESGEAHRESRFYRETPAGWQRTSPRRRLLGPGTSAGDPALPHPLPPGRRAGRVRGRAEIGPALRTVACRPGPGR